jgi:hypothetical protein
MKLYYNWFHKFKPNWTKLKLSLNNDDIMSEKVLGRDWKLISTYTLRQASGKLIVYILN